MLNVVLTKERRTHTRDSKLELFLVAFIWQFWTLIGHAHVWGIFLVGRCYHYTFFSFPAKLFFALVAKVRPVLPLHPLLSHEVMDCSPRHHNGDRYIEVQFFCFSLFRIMWILLHSSFFSFTSSSFFNHLLYLQVLKYMYINPSIPRSDSHETSPYNIHTLSSKQVIRIFKLLW